MEKMAFQIGDVVLARYREWLVTGQVGGALTLKSLDDHTTIILHPDIELMEVGKSSLSIQLSERLCDQPSASLYATALRLSSVCGIGPFRSSHHWTFEPCSYQLVPLLMSLNFQVPRLLIADDMGLGKTVEAGLIAREFLERRRIRSFAICCPPDLVEWWRNELSRRFKIEAVAITRETVSHLKRDLPISSPLFQAYPFAVVSFDYLDVAGQSFSCIDLMIVDEVHTCFRAPWLRELAQNSTQGLIMLTSTPPSGDEESMSELLSLISPDFHSLDFEKESYQQKLASHYIGRRRSDVRGASKVHLPVKHQIAKLDYVAGSLGGLQDQVLGACLSFIDRQRGAGKQRYIAEALMLMRAVISSPLSAARCLQNSQNRSKVTRRNKEVEKSVFDETVSDEEVFAPWVFPYLEKARSTLEVAEESNIVSDKNLENEDTAENSAISHDVLEEVSSDLAAQFLALCGHKKDKKLAALTNLLQEELLPHGFHPVIFCRFSATVDYLCEHLHATGASVCGVHDSLSYEECQWRVESLAETKGSRILVTTDGLAGGIDLQQLFNAVIHYDLAWNPIRHHQRDGRVDRFGQVSRVTRSVMMYGTSCPVDSTFLEVIFGKAEAIHNHGGVVTHLPRDRESLMNAICQSLKFTQRHRDARKEGLGSNAGGSGGRITDKIWLPVLEAEKRSLSRLGRPSFVDNSVDLKEVESQLSGQFKVSMEEVWGFLESSLKLLGASYKATSNHLLIESLPGISRIQNHPSQLLPMNLVFGLPVPYGCQLAHGNHPLVSILSTTMISAATGSDGRFGLSPLGAWPSDSVLEPVVICILGFRHKIIDREVPFSVRGTMAVAIIISQIAGDDTPLYLTGEEAWELLARPADGAISVKSDARDLVREVYDALPELLEGPVAGEVRRWVESGRRIEDHGGHQDGPVSTPTPEICGLFVLLPSETPKTEGSP